MRLEVVPLEGIRIRWDASANGGVLTYNLLRVVEGKYYYGITRVENEGSPDAEFSYFDSVGAQGGTHTYAVWARYSRLGAWHQSKNVSVDVRPFEDVAIEATGTAAAAADFDPRDFRASRTSTGISLGWSAPTGRINGYKLLRQRTDLEETSFRAIFTDNNEGSVSVARSFTDTDATVDGVYVYKLESLNAEGARLGTTGSMTIVIGTGEQQSEPNSTESPRNGRVLNQNKKIATIVVATETPSPTATETPTLTPSPTATATATDTPSPTATYTVTPSVTPTATVAPDDCSLADRIRAANTDRASGDCPAGSGADTITLTGDIVLSRALPVITSDITIDGAGFSISGERRSPDLRSGLSGRADAGEYHADGRFGRFGRRNLQRRHADDSAQHLA